MISKTLHIFLIVIAMSSVIYAAGSMIYYDPTIKNIIQNDCGRCHSGPSRYLMDYDSLKMYADNGILSAMVQGPMSGFAGNDAATIIDWVNQGAQEKPPAQPVRFNNQAPVCINPAVPLPNGSTRQTITYHNTIQAILAKDCLRCHSGQFRNLTTYDNVKIYVDNGLLKQLVQRGGPMHRFACQDSRLIIAWVDQGALP